jgi:hypothetical protein
MVNRSFFYSEPRIYIAGLRLLHGKNLDKRYEYISEKIGQQKTVLEPACGPALLPKFLQTGCEYRGFDINERFVRYAQGNELNVNLGNVEELKYYSQSDAIVICDALHHIGLYQEKTVLENSLKFAKQQLIICDPFKDYYMKAIPKWFPGAENTLEKWYNYIEKDGNNKVELKNVRTKKELEEAMMEGFGIIPREVKRELKNIGEDLIITYYL